MVYITVLVISKFECNTELPWIQNPYADAYLEDFVQKHLQARTLV